jgi:DNA-directed RNA polymerase specialized sigma24 family protein
VVILALHFATISASKKQGPVMNTITQEFIDDLFVRRDRLVYGIAWKILQNEADVEDCTQDLWFHASDKCVDRIVMTTPRQYMAGVTWNFTLDFDRKNKSLGVIDVEIPTIDQSIAIVDAQDLLDFYFQQLEGDDQMVLNTQMIQKSSLQCANALEITVKAWQQKLSRTRRRLADLMGDEEIWP